MRRCITVAALVVGGAAASTPRVDPTITYGTWRGWGTSLAWWARTALGNSTVVADLLWTLSDNVTAPAGSPPLNAPALGLNIGRYNAGASSWNTLSNGQKMVVSPNIASWRQIPSFWLDPSSTDPSNTSAWDWAADANQIAATQLASARGGNLFELFSNSPPWFLLANLNPSGSNDGTSDNLLPQFHSAHAGYMAEVARQFALRYNISFATVEPFNEPVAWWWKATGTQEGCHFDPVPTQAAVLPLLRAALDERGLNATLIAASDESQIYMALDTWAAFNATTKSFIDQVNVHGYQGLNANRSGLYAEVVSQGGKLLRMSEHGDGDASGVTLVANLHADLAQLHPLDWVYWQIFDSDGGWTLVNADPANGVLTGGVNDKYFGLAQFSRHIRQGMTMLNVVDAGGAPSGSSLPAATTAAAWDAATDTLVVVASNMGNTPINGATIDLSAFSAVKGPVTRWVTQLAAAGGDKYARYTDTPFDPTSRTLGPLTWAPQTVVTFEVQGVTL